MDASFGYPTLLPTLQYVVNCFKFPQDGIICVANLGCSCGANTLNVANIISISFHTNGALEIQHFFNDLPINDFNVLFQQFPPLDQMLGGNQNINACSYPLNSNQPNIFESNVQLQQPILDFRKGTKEMEVETRKRLYYVAGVQGSFWECLFPSSSFHLIISCHALHWITHVN
jgi:gibberellin A4 carboxyl methyltransferase